MLNIDEDKREALLETLYDLKHDLGKYIKLPVALLPQDAPGTELSEQVIRAVRETRKGPSGTRSAKQLFTQFVDEWGGALDGLPSYERLKRFLDDAEQLAVRAEQSPSSISRREVESVLFAVADEIGALLTEVESG
jgi:hypothetical protein